MTLIFWFTLCKWLCPPPPPPPLQKVITFFPPCQLKMIIKPLALPCCDLLMLVQTMWWWCRGQSSQWLRIIWFTLVMNVWKYNCGSLLPKGLKFWLRYPCAWERKKKTHSRLKRDLPKLCNHYSLTPLHLLCYGKLLHICCKMTILKLSLGVVPSQPTTVALLLHVAEVICALALQWHTKNISMPNTWNLLFVDNGSHAATIGKALKEHAKYSFMPLPVLLSYLQHTESFVLGQWHSCYNVRQGTSLTCHWFLMLLPLLLSLLLHMQFFILWTKAVMLLCQARHLINMPLLFHAAASIVNYLYFVCTCIPLFFGQSEWCCSVRQSTALIPAFIVTLLLLWAVIHSWTIDRLISKCIQSHGCFSAY